MPDAMPLARSPFLATGTEVITSEGWLMRRDQGSGAVAVADRSNLVKVLIRAPMEPAVQTALGTRFGRASWSRDRLVVGSAPGEWLVLTAPGTAEQTVSDCRRAVLAVTEELLTVMDLTHGRALLRVSGAKALELLRRLSAADLDDRFVPQGAALRTSVARVVTDLVRDDVDGNPSYLMHCERSSGRYLLESLLGAGEDLGAHLQGAGAAWPDHDVAVTGPAA